MRDDFCIFILSHGRPDRMVTWRTLEKFGYTGRRYIVIDDEDKTADKYREEFGDSVIQFCKSDVAKDIDIGDNFGELRGVIYARNFCFEIAKNVGCKYFLVLDDDYSGFYIRVNSEGRPGSFNIKGLFDETVEAILDFFIESSAVTVAMSQGGDHIGGEHTPALKRKAMNSFFCSTDRPFSFVGRVNEDTTTYSYLGRAGVLFFTIHQAQLNQAQTQIHGGGMTDLYLDSGTYVKTFYSVMYAPSCVMVGTLRDPRSPHLRIHHDINWHRTAPKIIREEHKKAERSGD